jgi:hypothetical protein
MRRVLAVSKPATKSGAAAERSAENVLFDGQVPAQTTGRSGLRTCDLRGIFEAYSLDPCLLQ